jgi:hypothetical protein
VEREQPLNQALQVLEEQGVLDQQEHYNFQVVLVVLLGLVVQVVQVVLVMEEALYLVAGDFGLAMEVIMVAVLVEKLMLHQYYQALAVL